MGNTQSNKNEFCNICVQHAGKEVILTIYEDKSIAHLRKEVKNECDFGDVEFALFVLLNGNREYLESNQHVIDLVEGSLLGSTSKAPTIYVELFGVSTAIATQLERQNENPANPISSPNIGQGTVDPSAISQFPTGEKFDVMLSYQWACKDKINQIYAELVAGGLKVWMDKPEMHGDIYQRMTEAVKNSTIFSPCLTLKYSESYNCMAEIKYAHTLRKPMVPSLLWKPSPTAGVNETFAMLSQVGFMTAGLVFVDFSDVEPNQTGWNEKLADLKHEMNRKISDLNRIGSSSTSSNSIPAHPLLPGQPVKPDILREWLKPVDFEADLNAYAESYVTKTRLWLLSMIDNWIADPNASQVMWLRGGAGVGKSIMAWFVGAYMSRTLPKPTQEAMDSDPPPSAFLGAQFYCKFNDSLKNDPHYVVQSIAYQLGLFDSQIQTYLSELCKEDLNSKPSLLDLDVNTKFDKLVLHPLREIHSGRENQTIVIILDALDECGEAGGKSRNRFLSALANSASKTRKNVKLLVTGRPEPDIFSMLHNIHCTELRPTDEDNLKDIKIYAQERLKIFLGTNKKLLDEAVDNLSAAADGVFVWMRLACDLISSKSPKNESEAMSIISEQGCGVDSMYHQLLENALQSTGGSAQNFRRVFGMLCVVRVPVPPSILSELLNMEDTLVSAELLRYRFLIEIMSSGAIKFMHKSVSDFLTNPTRCRDIRFSIDLSIYETVIFERCLDVMMSGLFPNIADLSFATIYERIPPSVEGKIPKTLSYCCRYWIEHFLRVPDISSDGLSAIYSLWKKHLLSWAEIMVINQAIQTAIGQLEKISSRMSRANELLDKLSVISVPEADTLNVNIPGATAAKFIENISVDLARVLEYNVFPISKCPLQLYCTGLAFCPTQTELWNTYKDILNGKFSAVKLTIGRELTWSPQLWTHECPGSCYSVVYSPDETMIAATTGRDIKILDVQFHSVMMKLEGHNDPVVSVAWSYDGTKIVSGSFDRTVRVWSATTGEQLMTLEGHSCNVNSVAWSHDGTRIVSGSRDRSVRLWSATTGEQLMKLKGRSNYVNSVAWSHDGKKIASGSTDKSMTLWSATTGEQLMKFEGHTFSVLSVAWSNDDTKIMSGSGDSTVRLWSATTGEQLMKLEGHSFSVLSVAWSHDGTKIVSGSGDSIVRVWSVSTGELLMKLEGHSSSVLSVAWSLDGTKIVSGSDDRTVKVWSATTGEQLIKPEGHSSYINSVAWSYDGTKIVSGSRDRSVRVWSAETGEPLMKLDGHSGNVKLVEWSHDGTKIVSHLGNGEVMLWSAVTGQQLVADSSVVDNDGNEYNELVLECDKDGWATMRDYKFWLSADKRGRIIGSVNGACTVNASKIFCFLK